MNDGIIVQNDPINFLDPYGLWRWGDPLPQGLVNAVAGFGDGVSFGLTNAIRNRMGTNGVVDKCSSLYSGSKYAGYAWGTATIWALGLNGGDSSVFWAGRGASAIADTLGTTITQTPIGAILDGLGVENRFVWTVASATFAANASGTVDAVINYVSPESIWNVEQAILNWRGIPIVFH